MTAAPKTSDAGLDPQAARSRRYSAVAVVLHWLIAFAIIVQVCLAWRFKGLHTPEGFALTQLHKSVGITILLLSLGRLGWRLANPPPPDPADMIPWEKALAHAVHWGFYVIMIGMPLTGWLMVSASRITIPTLLYGVIPWPDMPGVTSLAPGARHVWHEVGETSHVWLSYGLYALFVLHVAGALKHQFVLQDAPVLPRMLPGHAAGRWRDWRLAFVAVAVVAAVALGELVTPPNPGMAPPPRPAAAAPAAVSEDAEALPAVPPSSASAAPPPAAPAEAPAAPAGPARWLVQPGSTLGFSTSWGGQGLEGRFERWRADILFSPQALDRSKVTVTIDLGSVNTRDAQRDAALPSPDWFDTAEHPRAVFTATKFEKTGQDRYLARGTLQLRGVTRPQVLAFRLTIDGDRAQANGSASLDRTVFGVGQGDFKGTDQIPGKVSVSFALKAKRAGG